MNCDDHQVGGDHYRSSYDPWNLTVDLFNGCYFLGSVNKYVTRWRKKGGVEDLRKAQHYLAKVIALYAAGRLDPPLLLSEAGATAIMRQYALANQLSMAESCVLSALALGKFDYAAKELATLIQENAK
jgi:hypothetical protein